MSVIKETSEETLVLAIFGFLMAEEIKYPERKKRVCISLINREKNLSTK